ncbi:hypothetical protein [Streptomyces yunnanensis]|uniref:cGMP-dependent protein kinase interacting domain-containing protein n=1 Tax=Streptomyces yunnanensis TaxID=156453 RepID=A0A9X8QS90_9ACTN|nr:hypothetical protein [Streptomyces yunnanensis]SHL73391.1 cGMP-dependent protein kinase interacting domain-containing protein [Streptomyces yunnanensis]
MTIRLILRLRRQLAEARRENARLKRDLHSLDGEIADVRDANTQLHQEAAVALARQVAAMVTIDQLTAERERLLAELEKAIDWATEVNRVNAYIDQQNRRLTADNERLRRELAALTRPVAKVIPLQQRGPDAA